jgi:hypothetical protein
MRIMRRYRPPESHPDCRAIAQGPHDAEPDQREVAQVLEVIGLHLTRQDLEIRDEERSGFVGLAAGLARLSPAGTGA